MNQLHRRMHGELARVTDRPARLLSAGRPDMFERPDIEQALRPKVAATHTSAEGVLLSLGIDPKLYQSSDDLVYAAAMDRATELADGSGRID